MDHSGQQDCVSEVKTLSGIFAFPPHGGTCCKVSPEMWTDLALYLFSQSPGPLFITQSFNYSWRSQASQISTFNSKLSNSRQTHLPTSHLDVPQCARKVTCSRAGAPRRANSRLAAPLPKLQISATGANYAITANMYWMLTGGWPLFSSPY